MMSSLESATVIIPTLNEARHIARLLDQLMRNDSTLVEEILVADGGSTDGTREIVMEMGRCDPRVRLIDNPDRIQSAGVNRAVLASYTRAPILIRMDAHAGYPDDYVLRLCQTMQRVGMESVVVRLRTRGHTPLQRAIAATMNSIWGTGGSAHRVGRHSCIIDHGHHAAIRRVDFLRLKGYDQGFVANEDAEFDCRLRQAGGRIWLAANIEVDYYPRGTLRSLARQYWRYGIGRAQTCLKHRQGLKLRQFAPVAIVLSLLVALVFGQAYPALLLLPLLYFMGCAFAATMLAIRARSLCVLMAAAVLPVMHISWGAGFLLRRITAWANGIQTLFSPARASAAGGARKCATGGDGVWKKS